MPRDIDQKKTRKALRKLRIARDRAQAEDGPGLSEWEQEFVEGVEGRLNTYGSAFNDPEKGALDEALSTRQSHIIKQIDKKARGKGLTRSGFKKRAVENSSNNRDINDDVEAPSPLLPQAPMENSATPRLVHSNKSKPHTPQTQAPKRKSAESTFRVISGGKSDTYQN